MQLAGRTQRFTESTILFRQSPFNARELALLTSGSKLYMIRLSDKVAEQEPASSASRGDSELETTLLLKFDIAEQQKILQKHLADEQAKQSKSAQMTPLDEQEKSISMFRQDLQCFDFGFHPQCFLLGNFRNIFYHDRTINRDGQVSIIASSSLSKYDLSFNKISCIKRLDDGLRFAFIDEQMLYVYAWRARKLPVIKQRLFASDIKFDFAEIAQCASYISAGCCEVDDLDLFGDDLIREIEDGTDSTQAKKSHDQIFIASPSLCLRVNIDSRQLPEVNQ